jgi:hypothetical protein
MGYDRMCDALFGAPADAREKVRCVGGEAHDRRDE